MNDVENELPNVAEFQGHKTPELSDLEKKILEEWGDEGYPNIEAIHENGCRIIGFEILALTEVPLPNMTAPKKGVLGKKLLKMLDSIPRENAGLDVVYRIRDFVRNNVKFNEPVKK